MQTSALAEAAHEDVGVRDALPVLLVEQVLDDACTGLDAFLVLQILLEVDGLDVEPSPGSSSQYRNESECMHELQAIEDRKGYEKEKQPGPQSNKSKHQTANMPTLRLWLVQEPISHQPNTFVTKYDDILG